MSNEARAPRQLPVNMGPLGSAANPHRGSMSLSSGLIAPGQDEVEQFGREIKVCGQCRHMDVGDVAQEKIHGERFYERLVREQGWKLQHLCSQPQDLGLCGASGGETMTGRFHKACDQFKPNNGIVRLRTSKG